MKDYIGYSLLCWFVDTESSTSRITKDIIEKMVPKPLRQIQGRNWATQMDGCHDLPSDRRGNNRGPGTETSIEHAEEESSRTASMKGDEKRPESDETGAIPSQEDDVIARDGSGNRQREL